MTPSAPLTEPPAFGRASPRLRIARLAAEAALAVAGVAGLEAGPLGRQVTSGGGERVAGVVVGALRDGRYEVHLHVACELVPLPALAERIRATVLAATASAGLADVSGPVHVHIERIADPPVEDRRA